MQKGAKFPKDRRIAKLEDHEKRAEDSGEDEGKNCELDQQCSFRSQRWEREVSWDYSSQLMSQTILTPLGGFIVD